jgi:hypothetical protein
VRTRGWIIEYSVSKLVPIRIVLMFYWRKGAVISFLHVLVGKFSHDSKSYGNTLTAA